VQLAKLIRQQQVTSEEVVSAHIAQVRRVNPLLNAMVHDRFELALAEAREADCRVRAALASAEPGDAVRALPPFLGVPCSIKECFAVAGLPQTGGSPHRRKLIARADATAVRRYRQRGGFVVLGITNVSELCMWWETHNSMYGCTNNPYDLHRIVGGSSGGEGALVGSGCAPVGLGSDVRHVCVCVCVCVCVRVGG
jgi:fatty acid amide hydrolase 2